MYNLPENGVHSSVAKTPTAMFKNFLKVAARNLLKRKGFTLINIFDLATGMAVCLLIVLATISYQAIQAAITNPVKSLRAE